MLAPHTETLGGTDSQSDASTSETNGNILVVEDDKSIREILSLILEQENFSVSTAGSVLEADQKLASRNFLVALIDLRLDDGDGLELVRKLASRETTAVIIISGRSDPVDKVIGIEVGADDYVGKPFETRELVARVKRHASRMRQLQVLGRSANAESDEQPKLKIGEWLLDSARHIVESASGERQNLSDAEFRTLEFMLNNRGQVMSRDSIYRYVVGAPQRDPLDRRIDVHVSSLRRKLNLGATDGIRTVHRVGYIVD
ncbi:response regulator transcription factor [Acuticoccus sp. MNP-M23]|uniref:response regulator transcription factor n=1 Tax=Acuticoccus sp. MNP-M23 TaxID=3072793 RepID=UPI002816267B|nr:response regulator transcription factor [Acuticoccus sp. MNP-M23]WMS44835.1 response regulator transcription factor [Acuticoccus sp. MNP-M23]